MSCHFPLHVRKGKVKYDRENIKLKVIQNSKIINEIMHIIKEMIFPGIYSGVPTFIISNAEVFSDHSAVNCQKSRRYFLFPSSATNELLNLPPPNIVPIRKIAIK